jgi:pimeloyl-ACP methyl ester carboxylesterase
MLEHFHGYRCLLLDRPGTGLSETYSVRAAGLPELGARFVGDVLDGLELERASVVASSFGGHLALRSAAAHPERIAAMVQMAAPALVPGATYPPFLKMLSSRILRRIVRALPPNEKAARMVLRQLGHGASLDAGRISPALLDWNMALQAHTDTMENDGAMIGDLLPRRDDVVLTAGLLGAVRTPTLFLWGADDTFGREDNARLVSGLVPGAELVMMSAAGHLPWLDDPAFVAAQTAAFLTRHGEPAKDGA